MQTGKHTAGNSIVRRKGQRYKRKLDVYQSRLEFRRENNNFELYRNKFYKNLTGGSTVNHSVPEKEIKDCWANMWNEKESKNTSYEEYLLECAPDQDDKFVFPTIDEFRDIIRYLPNWKAAGVDEVLKEIIVEGNEQPIWIYQGLKYLIPEGTLSKGSDFRPITCMPNLYKLTTKCVTQVMQLEVEKRGLLAENQLGLFVKCRELRSRHS
ncbi:hypothetical protein NUSPORA_02797 [Nucleospora cyclopteri]